MRVYAYVGPVDILRRAASAPPGLLVQSARSLMDWLRQTGQRPNPDGLYIITFVVDDQGRLRIADRRSEHISCSAGEAVRSAGEMFLRVDEQGMEVVEVSNQSTGFCPEPRSWPAVAAALDALGIRHPGRFTQEVLFRRCPSCGERNIIKDEWFVCGVCGAALPAQWNF